MGIKKNKRLEVLMAGIDENIYLLAIDPKQREDAETLKQLRVDYMIQNGINLRSYVRAQAGQDLEEFSDPLPVWVEGLLTCLGIPAALSGLALAGAYFFPIEDNDKTSPHISPKMERRGVETSSLEYGPKEGLRFQYTNQNKKEVK